MIHFLVTQLPKELPEQDLLQTAEALSRALRQKGMLEISLSFVTRSKIQSLNKRYRGKDRPTDVLSFSSRETKNFPSSSDKTIHGGDVIVCPAYAREEAKRRALPLREELIRLIVHGVLHLAGYDHANETEELAMFALQERLVERLVAAHYG